MQSRRAFSFFVDGRQPGYKRGVVSFHRSAFRDLSFPTDRGGHSMKQLLAVLTLSMFAASNMKGADDKKAEKK